MKRTLRAAGQVEILLPDSAGDVSDLDSTPESTAAPSQRWRSRTQSQGESTAKPESFSELEVILDALSEQDSALDKPLQTLDRFEVDVGAGSASTPPARRAGSAQQSAQSDQSLDIDVNLAPGEAAVILIEQEGTFEWHFPTSRQSQSGQRRGGSSQGPQPTQDETELNKVSFQIPIGDSFDSPDATGIQRNHRGPITNFITGKIKGIVLKFVAKKVVGALSKRLERGVVPGPVLINSSSDATQWTHLSHYPTENLPSDRPRRVLLLVHGTFSSTLGSYGALTANDEGSAMLEQALKNYDLVIGFDHYTLSETPEQNAETLLLQLSPLLEGVDGLEVDSIAFSRGGLVFRFLSEVLVPDVELNIVFRKVLFVGCTNAGTELANDENWKHLIDFYTNMVAGASRLIGMAPGAALPAKIISQGIKTIGSLVTYIAQDGIGNSSVPGIAAMEPKGAFVQALNSPPQQRSRPAARAYYTIGSNFQVVDTDKSISLGKRVVLKVADGVMDRLMGKDNDLVVNNDSMSVIDPAPGARLIEQQTVDANNRIYHTVYFHQPFVANTCGQWLGLFQATPANTRNAAQAPTSSAPRSWWNSAVANQFLLLPATTSISEANKRLNNDSRQFVVLQRLHEGELLFYGYTRDAIAALADESADEHLSLFHALELHEWQSSSLSVEDALSASSAQELNALASAQGHEHNSPGFNLSVITTNGKPSGVVRSRSASRLVRPLEMASMIGADVQDAPRSVPDSAPAPEPVRNRRASRSGGTAPEEMPHAMAMEEQPAASGPDRVWCHMHALMPEQIAVDSIATMEVTLSRDLIAREAGLSGAGEVTVDRPLIVQIIARKHCDVVGSARVEIDVPKPGVELPLFFEVKALHVGLGEVDVLARQGNQAVIMLKLRPSFIEKDAQANQRNTVATGTMTEAPPKRELSDVLYIYDGEMGSKRILEFHLHARKLGIQGRYRSEPFVDEDARIKYIANLYEEIEKFWAQDQDSYDTFMQKLMARGANLYDKLIPKELQELLWESRESIGAIQVYSDEPFVPWELLYLKEPGRPARQDSFFLAERGLFRWISNSDYRQYAPDTIRIRPSGFKYIVPEYPTNSGYVLAGAQAERKMLEDKFNATAISATAISVQQALTDAREHDVLHFACHGLANSASIWNAGLLMQGEMDGDQYKEDHLDYEWTSMFADLRTSGEAGPLVFLNACQIGRQGYNLTATGGFAQAFVTAGASAFIGSHWSVGDKPAYLFSKTFYDELLNNEANIMEATRRARDAAKNNQEITWLAYAVYADPFAKIVDS